MKSEKDAVSQVEAGQEVKVEDLPVDEQQQDQVKGGSNTYRGTTTIREG